MNIILKFFIIIVIFTLTTETSFGQRYTLEDIKKMEDDTLKVNHLIKLASKNKYNDSLSRYCVIKAKEISETISYKKGLSSSLFRLGFLEKRKGNHQKAISYYLKCLSIRKEKGDIRGVVIVKTQLGQVYQNRKNYDEALKYGKEALKSCLLLKDTKLIGSIYGVLASIYLADNNFSAALEAYHESIKVRERIGDEKNLAKSYLNIGNLYNILKKKDLASFYLSKSMLINEKTKNFSSLSKVYTNLGVYYKNDKKLDSALIFYNKSLSIKDSLNLGNREAIYNNIGLIYQEKELFDLAEKEYSKSIKLAIENKNELQLLDVYLNIGTLYRKQDQNIKALNYLKKSYDIANKYNKQLDQLNLLMGIAEAYEHIGDYKNASLYNEKHIVLRDVIDEKFRKAELYQREKQKNLIVVSENKRKNIQLYSLVLGMVLLGLLFFALFYAYKSKKGRELAEQNQKLEVQKNIELLKKQEFKSIKAMIDGQESERKRIAQDLHDRLGSMLSMVKLNYKSIEDNIDKLKDENKKQYSQANYLLDEACNTVREIAHNMVSGVLTKFGLVAALEDLKNTIKGTNTFQLELITYGLDDRLENSLEMELYGIVQELIHNVIKHAKAKEVSVQLLKRVDSINLTVIDDGIGFDNSIELSESGMGLKSVASRVHALNGTFDIDTGRGNGTTLNIDVPL
ncbi:ATP-binding protein [Tenacibaculum ovolyticum]|uniref:ATP-binding protein n=1 Tax=Tenacibaculum ovolyticum TaxID=104270 RepID=UPI0009EF4025|nr:sensor histidine kinase [Tenacibaculum ovolyticum]